MHQSQPLQQAETVKCPSIHLSFYGDTVELLRKPPEKGRTVTYSLRRRASIKDIIEGLGVPHTEVGAIVLARQQQNFAVIPSSGDHFHIHPLSSAPLPIFPSVLRPQPLPRFAFMADSNVNRLSQLLRMAGIDARSAPAIGNAELARQTVLEQRILLSRNRDLLKHRMVLHGRLVRNQNPYGQLAEIVDLYRLQKFVRPFSRCMRCNGLLSPVRKEEIVHRLLPLTRKYYTSFKQCSSCGQIYWPGSHHDHMMRKMAWLLR